MNLRSRNTLATTPITMAIDVGMITQRGSASLTFDPSGRPMARQVLIQPARAINIEIGPKLPLINGVISRRNSIAVGFDDDADVGKDNMESVIQMAVPS